MRILIAVATAVSTLMLGFWAISQQAQSVAPTANTSATYNSSYNTSVGVIEGISTAGAQAVPWFGVAAVVLAACGFLVYVVANGGGR